jgi:hypothetical protein
MTGILFRFRKWFNGVLSAWLTAGRLRFAGMTALVVMLIAGINAITGSGEETKAAAGFDKQVLDGSNVPYDFQFTGQGRITAGAEEMWVIGGLPIQVDERTQLINTFHVGDFVFLSGRISDSGVWLADRIEPGKGKSSYYTFNGPLEWVRGSLWRIGGHSLLVDLGTKMGPDLASSKFLLATFTVLEGGAWQALDIKAFDPSVFAPKPTSSPTLAPTEKAHKSNPTATVMPASAEGNDGREDGSDHRVDDDDDDKDGKRDDKGKGKRDDKGKGKRDDKDKGKRDDKDKGDRKDTRDD